MCGYKNGCFKCLNDGYSSPVACLTNLHVSAKFGSESFSTVTVSLLGPSWNFQTFHCTFNVIYSTARPDNCLPSENAGIFKKMFLRSSRSRMLKPRSAMALSHHSINSRKPLLTQQITWIGRLSVQKKIQSVMRLVWWIGGSLCIDSSWSLIKNFRTVYNDPGRWKTQRKWLWHIMSHYVSWWPFQQR